MNLPHRLRFTHRHNPDDTFDCICERCLRTIATRPSRIDFFEAERDHECREEDLRRTLNDAGASYIRVQLDAILHSRRDT